MIVVQNSSEDSEDSEAFVVERVYCSTNSATLGPETWPHQWDSSKSRGADKVRTPAK